MIFAAREQIDHFDHVVTIAGTHGLLKCPPAGACGKSGVHVVRTSRFVTDPVMDFPASVKHFGLSQKVRLRGKKLNHVKREPDNWLNRQQLEQLPGQLSGLRLRDEL